MARVVYMYINICTEKSAHVNMTNTVTPQPLRFVILFIYFFYFLFLFFFLQNMLEILHVECQHFPTLTMEFSLIELSLSNLFS